MVSFEPSQQTSCFGRHIPKILLFTGDSILHGAASSIHLKFLVSLVRTQSAHWLQSEVWRHQVFNWQSFSFIHTHSDLEHQWSPLWILVFFHFETQNRRQASASFRHCTIISERAFHEIAMHIHFPHSSRKEGSTKLYSHNNLVSSDYIYLTYGLIHDTIMRWYF